jgi:saccharopine dehydrogenase (NAD+, L-lysine-forming)
MIVTGLGASPGLTNMGVAHLAKSFDSVRKVDLGIYQPLDAGGGEAVFAHMLHIMSGQVATFRQGQPRMIPAVSETRDVVFPEYGTIKLWNMGHAEPVTIPRYFDVDEVNFFMGYGIGAEAFVWPAKAGFFESAAGRKWALKLIVAIENATRGDTPGTGAIRIDVTGSIDGREETRTLCGTGQMREATGLSLAVGTAMLARGELTTTEGGVYAPEGCLDPDAFIRQLAQKGVEAFYDVEMRESVAERIALEAA